MSLLLTGITKHSDKDYVFPEEEWVHQVQEDTPLVVTYAHTTRKTPVIIDTLRSKRDTERGKNNAKLLGKNNVSLLAPLKKGFKFLGKELMWSNKLRLTVIANGIHNTHVCTTSTLSRPSRNSIHRMPPLSCTTLGRG